MKERIIAILFTSLLFGFSITTIILKDKEISSYERRKLTTSDSLSENFLDNLDDYLTDQFPVRNTMISINSIFDRYILGNIDSNNVYIKDGYIIDKNYPAKEKNITGFIKKINYINEKYLQHSNVFYTIIPDKSYFLEEDKYLKIDYDKLLSKVNTDLNIPYIDIIPLLNLDDYYKTDIHIKQESYEKIIKKLTNKFNLNYQNNKYQKKVYDNFFGASYSKVAKYVKPDKLTTMSNDIIENAKVKHLEYKDKKVYDIKKLDTPDLYNIYLSGPSSLVQIENPNKKDNKELIIFRDSFASSFAPLLIPYYKKITLIDLRYIKMDIVSNYIDFKNKDVLFAYSTLIINESNLLKVNNK